MYTVCILLDVFCWSDLNAIWALKAKNGDIMPYIYIKKLAKMFSNYSVKEPYKIVITIYECFVMVLNCCMKTDSLVKT